jgi:multiple sugar transport system substrate-binding protein
MKRARRGLSRRDLVKGASAALAASAVPLAACARKTPARAARKTLRILQWSHFVPGYDRWFDSVYTKEWGEKNATDVIVDHITATEVAARGASEAAAGKGHDLFLFQAPPAAYAERTVDLRDIVEAVGRRHGKMIALAEKSTRDPATGKFFSFSDSYVPDPGNYRIDLWSEVGFPKGPDTWEDLRVGGRKIKEKFGNAVGLGLSQETDSNMALRALLWSFGGAEQDAEGRTVTLNSRETVAALEYMRALFREAETAEVFTWDPSSNNRAMLSGRASFIQNAISVTRTAEKENPDIARRIGLCPALRGPVRRIASEHIMNCYVVWKFAENVDGAKQFLVDLVDRFGDVFRESEFYNFPCFPSTVPDLEARLAKDPHEPPLKYAVLSNVLDWTTNVGYPAYATPATDEVFNTYLIPTMFARVARGDATAPEAAEAAQREVERIFKKWKRG